MRSEVSLGKSLSRGFFLPRDSERKGAKRREKGFNCSSENSLNCNLPPFSPFLRLRVSEQSLLSRVNEKEGAKWNNGKLFFETLNHKIQPSRREKAFSTPPCAARKPRLSTSSADGGRKMPKIIKNHGQIGTGRAAQEARTFRAIFK